MTDTSGTEPHDQDLNVSSEIDAVQDTQETTTEAPSDYEFSDDALPEDPAEEKPAKRSAFLPIAAAVGGLLLMGSVAWWSLKGDSAFSLLPATNNPLNAAAVSAPTPFRPDDFKIAAPVPATTEAVATKTDSADQKEETAATSPLGVSSNALPSAPEQVPQQAAAPTEAPAPQSAPAVPVSAQPVAEPAPALAMAASPAPTTNDAIQARADSLQKDLDLAKQQIDKLTAERTALAEKADTAEASAKALQDKVAALEQKLSAVSPKEAADAPIAKAPKESVVESTGADQEALPTPVEKPAPVVKKASRRTAQKAAKTTAKPSSSFVLRAVSGGHAWISKNAASSELMEVVVGDPVPGIGSVKAIEQINGKWVVRGTRGTIQ